MLMSNCAGCQGQFIWVRGKLYCSDECRRNHQWGKQKAKVTDVWQNTTEFDYPESLRSADAADKVRAVIQMLNKTGVSYYRLGCPRNGARPPFILRWFPCELGARAFLKTDPFEPPDDMPLPGLYLLALFGADQKLIEQPRWKLPILGFNPNTRWYSGTIRP